MHSLHPDYLANLRFSAEQTSTLRIIGEFRGKQDFYRNQTPEALESLRSIAIVESTESSNRIEGIEAPHARIEAIVRKTTTPRNRSEQEIAGYRDALALIHESGRSTGFTPNVVLQLHRIIYRYLPDPGGKWKEKDNVIADKTSSGGIVRIRFRPTTALETPHAMDTLTGRYAHAIDTTGKEPLVLIPLAVFDFLCVHPFQDGNGRVARLLTLMFLYHFGYEVGRYISLERVFEESRETYYESLERSSQKWHDGKHDSTPWLEYFWGVLIRAYREFEERVGTIRSGRGSKTEQIEAAIDRKIAPFSISQLEADCPGVSRDMIRLVVRRLRDEGKLESTGRGRGARWLKKERQKKRE